MKTLIQCEDNTLPASLKASILPGLNFNLPAFILLHSHSDTKGNERINFQEMYTLGTLIIIYRNSISFQSEQDHIQARRSQDNRQMDTLNYIY